MTTNTEAALVALAMKVGSIAVSGRNVLEAFSEVSAGLVDAVHAAGAAIVILDLRGPAVVASDSHAEWLAQLQCRSVAGPLQYAWRSGQSMVTPDLMRVGPPELAAAAAECGLVTSVVVPLLQGEQRLGAVQLFGDAGRPVGPDHVETLRTLLEALSARLVDMLALNELAQAITQEVSSTVPPVVSPPMPPAVPTSRQGPQPWRQPAAEERASNARVDDPTDALPVVPHLDDPSSGSMAPRPEHPYSDDTGAPASAERAEDGRAEGDLPSDRSDAVGLTVGWFTARQPDGGHAGPTDKDRH